MKMLQKKVDYEYLFGKSQKNVYNRFYFHKVSSLQCTDCSCSPPQTSPQIIDGAYSAD